MEDRDPIKHLQHLLDDPGKVLERISRIQSALGSIHVPNAEAPPATPPLSESIAKTEVDTYSNLLQTLRDMQVQIEECLRPLALQAVQAEGERLREWMKHEQRELDECLARIDQNLLACVDLIRQSQKIHADLSALKERLDELGASPSSLPEFSPSQDPSEIIKARLESLGRDGK